MDPLWFYMPLCSVLTPVVYSTNALPGCDGNNITCIGGKCDVNAMTSETSIACDKGDNYTLVIVLVSVLLPICLACIAVFAWHRRKRQMRQKYKMITSTRAPKENNTTRRNTQKKVNEWDFDNTIYESAIGVRSLPRVKTCPELKGDLAEYNIKQEFKALPQPDAQSSFCGRLTENLFKNRYKNIIPYDSTRVCLAVVEEDESDYINASYIDGYRRETQYIASQGEESGTSRGIVNIKPMFAECKILKVSGPTQAMMGDFWKMIWQIGVTKIVMLTNLVEAGRVKCEMYWPDCGTDYCTYGDVSVQCVEEKVFEHHTFRSLAVWKANCQSRMIKQLHYTSWPAQGVPAEVTSLIDFYKVVKNNIVEEGGPTLVHCSAGVGRTGTFLALIYLIEQAKFERRACVFSCVQDIRWQRMEMVNTEEQYVFLYRVLTGALETRGILTGTSTPVWLQCRLCWETDRQHPILNSQESTDTLMDRDHSNSYACLDDVLV